MEDNIQQSVEETTEVAPDQEETQVEEPTEVEEANGESDESTLDDSSDGEEAPEANKRSYRQERRFAKMSEKIRKLSEQQAQAASQSLYGQAPQIPLDQEIPYDQYQSDVARQAQALTDIKLQQFRMEQQAKEQAEAFDRDLDYIERKYEELNEDSPKYDEKLAAKITSMYERVGINNPDVRLRDLVEDVMEVANRKSAKSSAKVSATVAKQAAETAIQSESTSKRPAKQFSELSLEEMEAQLGIAE